MTIATEADSSDEQLLDWQAEGHKAIADGKVAFVLVAGDEVEGQPVGCRDIGLVSGKSLFQLFAERLLKMQQLAAQAAYRLGRANKHIHW